MPILRSKVKVASSLLLLTMFSLASIPSALAGEDHANPFPRLLKATAWVQTPEAGGTAWVFDREHGLMITNYHVVDNEAAGLLFDKVDIIFPVYRNGKQISERSYYEDNESDLRAKGRWVTARVIDAQESVDLALLKVERLPDDVLAVPLAAESANSNDHLVSIGNSDEQALWLSTAGTVRTVSRRVWCVREGKRLMHLDSRIILTDAPTNHGDSGGPVVNDAGELVGVTEGMKQNANQQNFAIDISEVRQYLAENAWMGKVTTAKDYARRARHYFADPTFENPPPRNRRVELALADLTKAISLDPKNAEYYLDRARIREYKLRSSTDVALRSMVKTNRPDLKSQFSDANFLETMGPDMDCATAMQLSPNNSRALARLDSISHTKLGLDPVTIAQLEEIVHTDPICIEAYEELYSLCRLSDPKRAIAAVNEVIRFQPANAGALAARASLNARLGNYDAALRDYGAALRLEPKHADYYRGRASVYRAMREPKLAGQDLATVVDKLEPENIFAWQDLGDLVNELGHPDKAVIAYTEALTWIATLNLTTGSPEKLLFARGKALVAAGDPKDARQDFKNALELVKSNGSADPQFEKEVRRALDALGPEK